MADRERERRHDQLGEHGWVAGCRHAGDSLVEPDRALEVVTEARERQPFNLDLVDIGGDAALEAAYREHLPVIEIDGVRAFTYFVSVDNLLERLG